MKNVDASVSDRKQFLVFRIGNEAYAFEISRVREVLEVPGITRIPKTPAHVLGVIDLRGTGIPLIDLKQKLGMENLEKTPGKRVIVLELPIPTDPGRTMVLGALGDSVDQVVEMDPEEMEAPPRVGIKGEQGMLLGMAKREGSFVTILDADRVFSEETTFAAQTD